MKLNDILSVIGISITFAGFINVILYQLFFLPKFNKTFKKFEFDLKQKDLINQEKWKHKRDACFNALNIEDGLLSNYSYPNVNEGDIKPGKITTEEDLPIQTLGHIQHTCEALSELHTMTHHRC